MRRTGCGWATLASSSSRRIRFAASHCATPWDNGRSAGGCWTRLTASPSAGTTSGPGTVRWPASFVRRRERSWRCPTHQLGVCGVPTSSGEKFAHVHQVLTADLPTNGPDGAIAYCATRCQTQELAEFLQSKGMEAAYVHAGLPPETRKNVHQSFIRGDLRAIVATNALAWVSTSRTCGWWSTPIYAVPWRITCRRRDALDRTRRLPVAVCSTHWTMWSASSACLPVHGLRGHAPAEGTDISGHFIHFSKSMRHHRHANSLPGISQGYGPSYAPGASGDQDCLPSS